MGVRLFLLFAIWAVWPVEAQGSFRNQLTFGGGWTHELNGYEPETAAVLEGSYGYRLRRHLQVEAGLVVGLQPAAELCSAHGCSQPHDRYYWVPFGLRVVAPLWRGRLEVSAGGGGVYEKYVVANTNQIPCCFYGVDGWGGYFVGGAAVPLDRGRHWWVGASPKWFLANPTEGQHDRWFVIPLEFSWRF